MLRTVLAPVRFLRRHPWLTLVALVILGAAAVNLWAWHHLRIAEQALRADELDEARAHVTQCLRVWRLSSTAHLLAARIERMSGHFPQAEQHVAACARLQGGPSEATQLEQILIRAQSGELRDVEGGLRTCVERGHPESARILESLAVGYIAESRMGRALACLDELVQREPQSPRAWHWRGWVHEWLQQEDMAVEDYRQALELAPARWSSRLRLVRILLGRNRPQEALPHLDELERTHPEDADVQVAQARLLQLNRKGQEAIRLLDQVLISHPHHFEALSLRGALANQYESAAKAEIWLQRALRENSADSVTLYLLQQCLKKQGKDSEATQVLDRLNARNADDRRLEKLWHQELQQTPHNPDLLAEIGAILVRLGDEKKGLTFLYRALEEDENHRAAHETLMRYHASKGDDHKAAEHRERLHRLKSPTPSGSTANK